MMKIQICVLVVVLYSHVPKLFFIVVDVSIYLQACNI